MLNNELLGSNSLSLCLTPKHWHLTYFKAAFEILREQFKNNYILGLLWQNTEFKVEFQSLQLQSNWACNTVVTLYLCNQDWNVAFSPLNWYYHPKSFGSHRTGMWTIAQHMCMHTLPLRISWVLFISFPKGEVLILFFSRLYSFSSEPSRINYL